MKKVAMLQPNYIPWKGVFDLIHRVDAFVFYDDVQYTKKDWRSRNKIPTAGGEMWLSVPVLSKGKRDQLICETEIDTTSQWQQKHFKTLTLTYAKAPYLEKYMDMLRELYLNNEWKNLSEMNIFITKCIAGELGIACEYYRASDLKESGSKEGEKVINICKRLGCDYFLNGPSAKAFMVDDLFKTAGIELHYMDYEYPEYKQLFKPFNHFVSVLDLLFNEGPDAPYYIWGHRGEK